MDFCTGVGVYFEKVVNGDGKSLASISLLVTGPFQWVWPMETPSITNMSIFSPAGGFLYIVHAATPFLGTLVSVVLLPR